MKKKNEISKSVTSLPSIKSFGLGQSGGDKK